MPGPFIDVVEPAAGDGSRWEAAVMVAGEWMDSLTAPSATQSRTTSTCRVSQPRR